MGNINELFEKVKKLNCDIENVLKFSQYESYDDLSGLDIDYNNPEQLLLVCELRGIMQKLTEVNEDMKYLARPIKSTSKLFKNSSGKYEMENGYKQYSCGHTIEAYIYDDWHEDHRWIISSVEHNGNDYYITRHKNVDMNGLKVRVR